MRFITFVAVLLCGSLAHAEFVQLGNSEWFLLRSNTSLHDGFWYYRARDSHGVLRFFRSANHSVSQADLQAVYGPELNPNWRAELLKVAAQRDQFELSARAKAQEQHEFVESVKALGLEGNFNVSGYGVSQFGYGPGYGLSAFGQRDVGNTLFGYTYASQVGTVDDPGAIAQGVLKLAEHVQTSSEKATQSSVTAAEKIAQSQIKVKSQEARLAANLALIQAAKSLIDNGWDKPDPTPPEPPVTASESMTDDQAVIASKTIVSVKCASCHNATRKSGGLDLTVFSPLSKYQKDQVVKRILTDDETLRMPLRKPPLSTTEKAAMVKAFGKP